MQARDEVTPLDHNQISASVYGRWRRAGMYIRKAIANQKPASIWRWALQKGNGRSWTTREEG